MSTNGMQPMQLGGTNKPTQSADNATESANKPIYASEKNISKEKKEEIEACKLFAKVLFDSAREAYPNASIDILEKAVIKEIEEKGEVSIKFPMMRLHAGAMNYMITERNRLRRQLAESRKREEYALAQLSEAQRQTLASSSGEEAYKRWKAQQGKGKPKTVIDWEAYDHLRAAKLNAKQIAAALGVSPNTLRARLKERSGAQPKDEPFDAARML